MFSVRGMQAADKDFHMQRRGLRTLSALRNRRTMRLLHGRRGVPEVFAVLRRFRADWPPCQGHVLSVQALSTNGMEASLASTR